MAHRWAGLTIALFLIIAGGTGSLLAFYPELERIVAPSFMQSQTSGPRFDPLELRRRAELLSGGQVDYVPLHITPGSTAIISVSARPGQSQLGFNEIALDPVSGLERGRRQWGDITQGTVNLMPFLYKLHYSLAAGDIGRYALGIAALIWLIDCFVGWYLTLPAMLIQRWSAWRKAWTVRRAPSAKLNFDLHRAGGLWLWPVLLVFAWSSVGFNLEPVYSPVMKAMVGDVPSFSDVPARDVPLVSPRLDWAEARDRGRQLVEAAGRRDGFVLTCEEWLRFDRNRGVYISAFQSDRDIYNRFVGGRAAFDADTGRLVFLKLPTGQHARTTVDTWLSGLHMGVVLGLPWRIMVSTIGLGVVILSVTGVIIWMRKRSARLFRTRRIGLAIEPLAQPAE
ncbi:PepSY-associated TM helix domain-containing protein [Sphingomonas radiodurans]|uniref:PepSY-associated TM helix domain-containing protein n=1 Tax=Sphingomonas radiodurans TaxID=2890321 RepID=UPI001E2BA2C5|nr:PepSY-associated TM helix domain-containing protein [Sphingomonas radiodurans]WBH15852.1 PepSY-associated TM helix domain-containing protein [Sphingomonas radiodurans]